MTSETEFIRVLKLVADRSNAKIRTILPGKIESFDATKQTATVTPAVQNHRWDPEEEAPVAEQPEPIANCPVWYPTGGGFSIRYPLDAGDDCLILVAERSIDEWAATGEKGSTPQFLRRFDLSDAIVLPGIRPPSNPLDSFIDDSMDLGEDGAGGMRIEIGGGKIKIEGGGTELLNTLETAFSAAQTWATAMATGWTAAATGFTALATLHGPGGTYPDATAATAMTTAATASTTAATASTTAASAFGTAVSAINSIRKI